MYIVIDFNERTEIGLLGSRKMISAKWEDIVKKVKARQTIEVHPELKIPQGEAARFWLRNKQGELIGFASTYTTTQKTEQWTKI